MLSTSNRGNSAQPCDIEPELSCLAERVKLLPPYIKNLSAAWAFGREELKAVPSTSRVLDW